MDPLSSISSVVTLLQVAKEIQKSIQKVPQNRRNLRKLTEYITEYLMDLKKACNDSVLDEHPEFHSALLELIEHMRQVAHRCHSLVVPSAKGRFNKICASFKAWSNCDAIEAELQDLKEKIQVFSTRFMVLALTYMEKPMYGVATATSRIERHLVVLSKQQQQGLDRMKEFAAGLQSNAPPDFSYSQTVTTITSSTTELVDLPSASPGTLYLHEQVEDIISTLGTLAATQALYDNNPYGPYLKPFKTAVPRRWMMNHQTPAADFREVVIAACQIVNVLQGPPGEKSIQNAAWDMVNLAIWLHDLGMYTDAKAVGSWTVDIYRTLLDTNPQVYEPYLALALRNLSRYKTSTGDYREAIRDIEECVARERDMLTKPSRHNVHLELSNSLLEWWGILTRDGNFGKGLKVAQEAFAILEHIRAELKEWESWFGDTADEPHYLETTNVEVTDMQSQSLNDSWGYISTIWLEFNTARAYHSLSYSLEDLGQIRNACNMELQALTIYRDLGRKHPGIHDDALAACLAHLSTSPLSEGIPSSLSLARMQESNQLYRKLAASRPAKFIARFTESLWNYATLLHDNGDIDAAERCSTEAVELIRRSNQDRRLLASALQESSSNLRRLKQNKTVITIRREVIEIYRNLSMNTTTKLNSTIVAGQFYDLACDHLLAGQKEDAVIACREAVRCYRSIQLMEGDGNTCIADLARSLSYLTHTLNVTQQFSDALSTGTEALALYRCLISENSTPIEPYLITLRRISFSACHASDDMDAIKIHADVVQALRTLDSSHPTHVKWRLVDALHDHDFILTKHHQIHKARDNTEELVNYFRNMSLEDPEVVSKFIPALITHAGSYSELGRVNEALLLCKEAISVGQKFTEMDIPDVSLSSADALATYSECLRDVGKYGEALPASKAALDIYRRYPRDDVTILSCKLREYAINLQHANRLPEAMAAAEEAVALCRSSSSTTLFGKIRLPYALETLSVILAEAGDEDRAFETILEAMNLYRGFKSNPAITEPWSYAETLYANTLVTISSHYAAKNNWQDAELALAEAAAIFKRRIVFASAYHPPLARALDLTAIHLCAAGRHKEAKSTADHLRDRISHLNLVDPEVAMLVQVALAEIVTNSSRSQAALRQKYLGCALCSSVQV